VVYNESHELVVVAQFLRRVHDHAVTRLQPRPASGALEIAAARVGCRRPFRHGSVLAGRDGPASINRVTAFAYGNDMVFANPLPKALSPSRLQDFQSCPRRFQHGSIDRLPQPASYATVKGNLLHYVFEHLFLLPAPDRSIDRARTLVPDAEGNVLTEQVRHEIDLDDARLTQLRSETEAILVSYFAMEDPREVDAEGVELRITEQLDGAPILGILDRLDREADGSLTIVDYKTGRLPNRNYDSKTFANAELYAALCESHLGQRPNAIRLLYVAHGEAIERPVTEPVLKARRAAAANAWRRIGDYYERGEFPATPSVNTCRFCAFKDVCRANGVAVPV
jgi:putative RecB family exonuclease